MAIIRGAHTDLGPHAFTLDSIDDDAHGDNYVEAGLSRLVDHGVWVKAFDGEMKQGTAVLLSKDAAIAFAIQILTIANEGK